MGGDLHAARFGEPVAHTHALGGFLAGALAGLAAAAGAAVVIGLAATAVAMEVATAGLATPLIAGVAATAGEFAVNFVVGGKLMSMAEDAGESLGSQSLGPPTGAVAQGSPDVWINGKPAARATDKESCHAGQVAQGSSTVSINGLPAARVTDKTSCGGVITVGSPNVVIGGSTMTVLPIQSEIPSWARWAVLVAGILPALGGLARAIGPALAAVEEQGFARALGAGVKALGRAMEERAGSARLNGPPIKLSHITEGEINARGRAVGFHYRPGGIDPADARMTQQVEAPDANGVYTGKVEVRDPSTSSWVAKRANSSFFPDNLSQQQITEGTLHAFRESGLTSDGQFTGDSGLGFKIQGWYRGGKIETAYPLREP